MKFKFIHSGEVSCIFNLLRGPDITRSGPDPARWSCIRGIGNVIWNGLTLV